MAEEVAEASPTGGETSDVVADQVAVEEEDHAEPEKPAAPERAHPIPQASVEKFPEWAISQPPRSPRQAAGSGAGAKYEIKNTQDAFSHLSLTNPTKYLKQQTRKMSQEGTDRRSHESLLDRRSNESLDLRSSRG